MVDPKLGTKRQCEACDAKFYDLNKKPVTCPKCQTLFDPSVLVRKPAPEKEIAPKAASPDEDEDELELDDVEVSLESLDDDDDDDLDDAAEVLLVDDDDDDDILIDDDDDDDDLDDTLLDDDDDDLDDTLLDDDDE